MVLYGMDAMFIPGMPRVKHCLHQFSKFFEFHLPELYFHFESEAIDPSAFASSWFLSLFTSTRLFPYQTLALIWDIFLMNGWSIIFQIALAILAISSDELMVR